MALYFTIRGVAFTAQDFADASAQYSAARDASGEGASTFPSPVLYENRKRVGRFSYNGRIWAPGAWVEGALPLYCPAGRGLD